MKRLNIVVGCILLGLSLDAAQPARAQFSELPLTPLPLDDLEAFRSAASHWQVVGSVYADRLDEHALATEEGQGILVNVPASTGGTNLATQWEHRGLELTFDFMMPREGDSGIFLQGRYEIQLADREEDEPLTFASNGGIYQRWRSKRPEGKKGVQGHPPRMEAGRAPGLWQHMKIAFEAPTFNAAGEKVENARFKKVVLNGVVIHREVEVMGPTQGAPLQDEKPTGPLMIQGTHGPIAIRNLRYKRIGEDRVRLKELRYAYYEGTFNGPAPGMNPEVWTGPYEDVYYEAEFEGVPDSLEVKSEGDTEALTQEVTRSEDNFALRFSGIMDVPRAGTYRFTPEAAGAAQLEVAETVVASSDEEDGGRVRLEAGEHPFTFTYTKSQRGAPGLALFVEGPGMPRYELTAPGSMMSQRPLDPILVEPEGEGVALRGFARQDGALRKHALFVGSPQGVHYVYDLSRAALLKVWGGHFLNMAAVWQGRSRERGSKYTLAQPRPLGSRIAFSGQPSVAFLDSEEAPWPDSAKTEAAYQFEGYTLDGEARPTFMYRVGDVEVTDRIRMEAKSQARLLKRTFTFSTEQPVSGELWVRVAAAERIERLPDGTYAVGDFAYYVDPGERAGEHLLARTQEGQDELLVPVPLDGREATVSYTIIW